MATTQFTPVIQYLGKNLYSATCPEYPGCHGVADSADAACDALHRAIEAELRKISSKAPDRRSQDDSR